MRQLYIPATSCSLSDSGTLKTPVWLCHIISKSLCGELLACSSASKQAVFPQASTQHYRRLCIQQLVSTHTAIICLLGPPPTPAPLPRSRVQSCFLCASLQSVRCSLTNIYLCLRRRDWICTSQPIVQAGSAAVLPAFQIFLSLGLPPSLPPSPCPSPLLHFKRNSSGATKAPSQKWRAPNETQRILNAGEFLRVHQTCKAAALKISRSSFRARLCRQPRLPLPPPSPQQGRPICNMLIGEGVHFQKKKKRK